MNDSDIKIYDLSLEMYSEIMASHGKSRTIQEIKECLEVFEKLEDYDKCRDLLDVIRIETNNRNVNR